MKTFTINSVEINERTYTVKLTAKMYDDALVTVGEEGVSLPEPTTSTDTRVEIAPLDMTNESECLSILSYTAIAALGLEGSYCDDSIPYVDDGMVKFEQGATIYLK